MTKKLFDRAGVRYEVAADILGAIIAHHTETIAAERAKDAPDQDVINREQQIKDQLRVVRDDLDPQEASAIERVIAEYGPQARALYGDEPKRG
ncbi:hypothetical protein WS86_00220 (plasmid) [Burkholderia savannae]|uniref:Uncharacterized protein n=1 Tax=Burkholderia savannae TaxID=1637837 RepID=A0ABR5T8C1_9BURK|nr:hypothetical protein [Burkholderia savannae]AOJ79203.1 hypothetical protein WS86_00220 [Burkholderia savannae]KWZ39536.1 hypothetical protein WS72_19180 [Burkholderia savannae]